MTALLAQAGGSVTVTQAEYKEIVDRYGGPSKMALHLEQVMLPGGVNAVRAMLVRKEPQQGELPV